MANKVPGYRQINGSWGQLWWDGELVYELSSFESKIAPDRADVQMAGSLDVDSKITGIKCSGSITIKKVFSRGQQKFLQAWQAGQDPRSQLMGKLADPDTKGKASERVVIDNVWFNEIDLLSFAQGQALETSFSFGFTLSDVDFPDMIPVTEG